jgi:hypothetical protein
MPLNNETRYYYLPEEFDSRLPDYMADHCEFEDQDELNGAGNGQRWVAKVSLSMRGDR